MKGLRKPGDALGPETTGSLLGQQPWPEPEVPGAWEPSGEVRKRRPPGPLRGRKWRDRPAQEALWLAWAVWSAWSGVASEWRKLGL